jgi:hypothetical protein
MKEKILFVIDTYESLIKLSTLKDLLKRFVLQKKQIFPNQNFGIILLKNDAFWSLPFTEESDLIIQTIDLIEAAGGTDEEFRFDSLFQSLQDCDQSVEPIRVVLIYARSSAIPDLKDVDLQKFYTKNNVTIDVLYLHEKASPDNNVQEIYEVLGKIETEKSRSYEMVKSMKK